MGSWNWLPWLRPMLPEMVPFLAAPDKPGIPTVLDRFVQQAVMQVLQGRWDRTFSEHSYGFRPGRCAHQAVGQAQQYIAEGYRRVVDLDLDLERFFDRVNHDRLMAKIAERVGDKRMGWRATRPSPRAVVSHRGWTAVGESVSADD